MSEPELTTLLAEHAADVGPISGYWKCACGVRSDNTRASKGGPMPTDRRAEYRAHLADAILRAGFGPVREVEDERDEYKRGWVEADVRADYAEVRAESADAAHAALVGRLREAEAKWSGCWCETQMSPDHDPRVQDCPQHGDGSCQHDLRALLAESTGAGR